MHQITVRWTRALILTCKRQRNPALPFLIAGCPNYASPCPTSITSTFSTFRAGGRKNSSGSKNQWTPRTKSRGKNKKSVVPPLQFETGTKFDDAIQLRVDNLGIMFGKAMEQIEIASEAPEMRTPILNSKKFYYNKEAEAAVLAAVDAIDEYNSITAALKGRVKNDFEKYNDNHLMIEQLKLEIGTFVLDE